MRYPLPHTNREYDMPRGYTDHSASKANGGTVAGSAIGTPSATWVGWCHDGQQWRDVCQRTEWADCEGATLAVARGGRISILPPGVHPLGICDNRIQDIVRQRGTVERVKIASGHTRAVMTVGDAPVPADVQERGVDTSRWRYNRGRQEAFSTT